VRAKTPQVLFLQNGNKLEEDAHTQSTYFRVYTHFYSLSPNSLQMHTTAQNYRILHKVLQCLFQPQNFETPPYSKGCSKEIMIQIKLVGMSTTFKCTKLHLSKRNGS
jgi:hypothetical protein